MKRDLSDLAVIIGLLFLGAGVMGLWMDRRSITPRDLAYQRAMDISSRVYGVCMELATDTVCKQVREVTQREIFAAGVEAEDRVMARAKEMARKAGVKK